MRFLIVRELHIDHGLQTMAEIGITYRDHEFDTVIEVSWHPVRTADIQLFTTAIGEPEDAAVLQEAADEASDGDVVTDAGDARDEYADPPDDELDPDACLRSFVELIYDLLIEEGIHLGDHVCLIALLGEGDLAVDELHAALAEIDRRDDEGVPQRRVRVAGEEIEEGRSIAAELVIAGEDAEIRIELGCGCIVVAGRDMDIAADAVLFAADDERTLRVRLEPDKAVDDMRACFFKAAGHQDVIRFIEARLDFHEYSDLLAVLCCFFKRLYDRRGGSHAVQGLLDGKDIGVSRCRSDEINDRVFKGFIRQMHEEIFLTDHLENILSTILFELDHGPGAMRMRFRIAEMVVALDAAEGKEHRHIERSVDLIQILLREVHLLRHEALHEAAGACFEFDTHGLPALAFFQLALHLDDEILCIFFIDRKIRVTRDAERMCFQEVVADKETGSKVTDDLLQEDEVMAPLLFRIIRQADDTGKHRWHRHDRCLHIDIIFLIQRKVTLIPFEQHRDIEALRSEERERMRGVDGHWRDDWEYLPLEIVLHPFLLRFCRIFRMDEIEPFRAKLGQKHMKETILARDELLAGVGDLLELLLRCHMGDVTALHAIFLLVLQPRHADHEEFIQIRTRDRQEFQFFQQGIVRIHCFLQYAAIELQPRQLAVQIIMLMSILHVHSYLRSNLASMPNTVSNIVFSLLNSHVSRAVSSLDSYSMTSASPEIWAERSFSFCFLDISIARTRRKMDISFSAVIFDSSDRMRNGSSSSFGIPL